MQLTVLVVMLANLYDVVFCACPSDWFDFDGSCYFFSTELKTRDDAKTYCTSVSAAMVDVTTEKENFFLKAHCMRLKPICTTCNDRAHYMTGGSDLETEETYEWESGDAFTYTDWAPGEPNEFEDNGGEDCIGFSNYHNYQWNDERCFRAMNFICEKPE